MTGLGVDLIEIERVERALARHPRLAGRVFSEAELAYAARRRRPGRHLAARFAAKEAALKALGAGDGLGLGDVEVVAGAPPSLRLQRRAAERASAPGVEVSVSLTHSRETAAAVALAHSAGRRAGNGLVPRRREARIYAGRDGDWLDRPSTTPTGCAPSIAGRSRSRASPRWS